MELLHKMLVDKIALAKNRLLLALDRKNEKRAREHNPIKLHNGPTRIYQYHVRKTGGTSINHAFFSLANRSSESVYRSLLASSTKRFIDDDLIFVGWNKLLLERGHYSYGFSHIPYNQICVPENTYTITCLRDPKQRILSHYKMLLRYSQRKKMSRGMRTELQWLDFSGGILSTLRNMPKEHLLNQIYMFSQKFDVDEALEHISKVDAVLMTETLGEDIRNLGTRLGLTLESQHIRRDSRVLHLTSNEKSFLDECMEPEYRFLEHVRRLRADR